MKNFLLSFFTVCLIGSANAQWLPQTCPTTNNLFSVYAIDPNAAAIAGITGLLRTTNAGLNWSQNVSLGGVNCYEVHTRNPFRWYALTQNASWFIKMGNPGGVTLNSGKPDSILSLHFINLNCAVAVGTAGKIETSCDTGATWQVRSLGVVTNLNAIWFADADTGCAVGATGTIIRTTDAGNTWTTVASGTGSNLNGIHFPNDSVGYIVGNSGKLLKTTNAGASWTNMPTGVLNTLNGVYFIDQDTGYVVGSAGLIMKTLNGGVNWYNMTSGTSNILNSVHFATPIDGWAVGNGGTILKYNGSGGLGINNSVLENHFIVYPNPAKDAITITTLQNTAIIKIHNAIGDLIYQTTTTTAETKVDIGTYATGVYMLEVITNDKTSVKKFIKE